MQRTIRQRIQSENTAATRLRGLWVAALSACLLTIAKPLWGQGESARPLASSKATAGDNAGGGHVDVGDNADVDDNGDGRDRKSDDAARPWYQGVSEEDQQTARALFREAADLKAAFLLLPASEKYREALSHWDHPEIRFELITVLAYTARAVEAWQELQALQRVWGMTALMPKDEARARAIEQDLLRNHLGELEVRCDIEGAEVAVDGKPMFVGPGVRRTVMSAGARVISAKKPGSIPIVETVALLAGSQSTVTLQMSKEQVRKDPNVKPRTLWIITGAGVATALTGTGLLALAQRDFRSARAAFDDHCHSANCPPSSSGRYQRGEWLNNIGTIALVVGGAAAIGGGVFAILNQVPRYDSKDEMHLEYKLVPMASPENLGISLRAHF